MIIDILKVFSIICIALVLGKIVAKVKLPAILGWLLAGIIFGPYLVGIVSLDIINELWFKITIKCFECLAGVMIGREIIFKKIIKSGKQIIGITFIQSLGTFVTVSAVFLIVFLIMDIPFYLAFIFGGIALATAPAPALSIVNEYKTKGPVTDTLIPLAAIDDVIGVIVFFTVISIISSVKGAASTSVLSIVLTVIMPFVIGIAIGIIISLLSKVIKFKFVLFLAGLFIAVGIGLLVDYYIFHSFSLNYLLIGMAYSATFANMIKEEDLDKIMIKFGPILNISLVIVIVNLGMPLNYKLIAGAGIFTAIYIISRTIGKISFSFIGGKVTKAEPTVTKYLGLTLLPHSGVSLVFTGIAVNMLNGIDTNLANILSGTIVAAAIINELIAVIVAKYAFKFAKELQS